MKRRFYLAVAILSLDILSGSVQEAFTNDQMLGERLVRNMWSVIKANDLAAQKNMYAEGFQTILKDGSHHKAAVLKKTPVCISMITNYRNSKSRGKVQSLSYLIFLRRQKSWRESLSRGERLFGLQPS